MKKFKLKSSTILFYLSIIALSFIGMSFSYAVTGSPVLAIASGASLFALSHVNFQLPENSMFVGAVLGRTPSQAQKIAFVNNKLGNKGVQKNQGTTRIIYDTLPLDGRTQYNFFENSSQRGFPRTNFTNNQLTVGEALVIKRLSLSVITFDAVTGQVTAIQTLDAAGTPVAFYKGELNVLIANQRTLKDHSMLHMKPEFNKDAGSTTDSSYRFYTDLVIPSLVNLVFQLRVPTIAAIATKELCLTVEGVGSLLNTKENF